MEAFLRLVPGPDFKSGGGCGDTSPAGSIPVRFRQFVKLCADKPFGNEWLRFFQNRVLPKVTSLGRLWEKMLYSVLNADSTIQRADNAVGKQP